MIISVQRGRQATVRQSRHFLAQQKIGHIDQAIARHIITYGKNSVCPPPHMHTHLEHTAIPHTYLVQHTKSTHIQCVL